jgi:hypothetical protein
MYVWTKEGRQGDRRTLYDELEKAAVTVHARRAGREAADARV